MIKLILCPVVDPFRVIEATKPLDGDNQCVDHRCRSDDVVAVDVRVRRGCNAADDANQRYTPILPIRECLAGQILDYYA